MDVGQYFQAPTRGYDIKLSILRQAQFLRSVGWKNYGGVIYCLGLRLFHGSVGFVPGNKRS